MSRVCALGLHQQLRGFSTNVANYNALGVDTTEFWVRKQGLSSWSSLRLL